MKELNEMDKLIDKYAAKLPPFGGNDSNFILELIQDEAYRKLDYREQTCVQATLVSIRYLLARDYVLLLPQGGAI